LRTESRELVRLPLAVAETRLVELLAVHGGLVVAKTMAKRWQDGSDLHGDGTSNLDQEQALSILDCNKHLRYIGALSALSKRFRKDPYLINCANLSSAFTQASLTSSIHRIEPQT
jgi:hypothetical protein